MAISPHGKYHGMRDGMMGLQPASLAAVWHETFRSWNSSIPKFIARPHRKRLNFYGVGANQGTE